MKENENPYQIIKRLFDIFFSIFVFILSSPLLLFVIVAIKIESKGPAIYKQVRFGKNKKEFNLYKLRSMYIDAENNGPKMTEKNDSRVTNVGRFIRKRRIDELPQMINILKGDMSLVGPRPERPYFYNTICESFPEFESRLSVPCGLTGWAQVKGEYDLSPEGKLSLDLYYIKNKSVYLDFIIIIRTIGVVLRGKNEN